MTAFRLLGPLEVGERRRAGRAWRAEAAGRARAARSSTRGRVVSTDSLDRRALGRAAAAHRRHLAPELRLAAAEGARRRDARHPAARLRARAPIPERIDLDAVRAPAAAGPLGSRRPSASRLLRARARALARRAARRLPLRAVRRDRGRPARGAPPRDGRGADRRGARAGPRRRARRRARVARRRSIRCASGCAGS